MKLSNHAFHFSKSDSAVYVFNNLIFDFVEITQENWTQLKHGDFSSFSLSEIQLLTSKGIIVDCPEKDFIAEQAFRKYVNENYSKDVSLLYIIPTNVCNFACKYCFIGELNDKKIDMSMETIKNLTSKYISYLTQNNIKKATIFFYGAEPLIAFNTICDIVGIFNKADTIEFEYSIVTNGSLLNNDMIRFLEVNNISLGLSIDGPEEMNDANRIFKKDGTGTYNCILQALSLLRDSKVKYTLSITLAREILENEEKYLMWLAELNVPFVCFNLLHFTNHTDDLKDYYEKASIFLIKAHKVLSRNGTAEDRFSRKENAFFNQNFMYSDCGAIGGNQLCISPTGNVTVCHGYWYSGKELCGNINVDSWDKILNSEIRQKWQQNLTIKKRKCLDCPAIFICGGGCAKQAEDTTGNQLEIDEGFCIHTKTMLNYFLESL